MAVEFAPPQGNPINMRPIIITSDVTSWSLRPMLYLLDKHWPQCPRPLIGGYTKPGFHLDADWYTIGRFVDYPVNKWSNGLLELLSMVKDEYILFMMDDYWLNSPANHDKIMELANYVQAHDNVARLDLTYDRLNNATWTDAATFMSIDDLIFSQPLPYQFSYQAAIWRKSLFEKCLAPNETPWESELRGSYRLIEAGYHVLGTKHPPLRYTIAVQQGKLTLDGGYQPQGYALPINDVDYIAGKGWIPERLLQHA